MKGLLVFIMGMDCTNGGATSGKRQAVLFTDNCEIFKPSTDAPALVLIENDPYGAGPGYRMVKKPQAGEPYNDLVVKRVRAVPVGVDGEPRLGGMFGGQFIETSDGRFPYDGPIPVFDRFEY